jgi:hypothetical protein
VQAKLIVGATDDPFEREADQQADRVVRSLSLADVPSTESRVRRSATPTDPDGSGSAKSWIESPDATPASTTVVSRVPSARIQPMSQTIGAGGGVVDDDTASRIRSARGGRPLDPAVRSSMEGAFGGADFDSVRVHSGPESAELNGRIQAKAFTTGSDIFFRDGIPDASTTSGQQLLAHELTHTIQQGAGRQGSADPISRSTERIQRLDTPDVMYMDEGGVGHEAPSSTPGVMYMDEGGVGHEAPSSTPGVMYMDEGGVGHEAPSSTPGVMYMDEGGVGHEAPATAEEQAETDERARLQAEAEAQAKAKVEAEAKAQADAQAEALRVAKEDKKYKTTTQILGLSLPELIDYVDQTPTWDLRSTITDLEKADIRSILAFSREPGVASTLDAYTVGSLRSLPAPLLETFSDLRCYVAAVTAYDPIPVSIVGSLSEAITTGSSLKRLLAGFPRWVLKTALNEECLDILIDHNWVDEVVTYYRTSVPQPIFQADTGSDFMSWMEARNEGWDPLDFSKGALAGKIRNFHRFTFDALERLEENYTNGNSAQLPLLLILHAAIDHNGAFHREDAMTDAITDSHNFVLMIEGGESLADYQSQIGPIATQFGVNQKIDQVMFAGHGNGTLIQMAGTVEDTGGKVGEVNERIDVVNEKAAADALFDEVLANMANAGEAAAQALLTPGATSYRRILFNACLTNSNIINMDLDDDNAAAQAEIRDYLSKNASLATYLGNKAKAAGYDVTSLGANASIGEVDLVDSSGGLDMVSHEDPKVTASKLEYAEEGIEPLGVLRAALESWGYDPDETYKAMARRVAAAVDDWDDIIIVAVYRTILKHAADGDSGIASILKYYTDIASSMSEMKHDAELEVSEISGSFNIGSFADEIDTLLADLSTSSAWASTPAIALVMYQIWMACFPGDTDLRDAFITHLGANFNAKSSMVAEDKYLDVGFLESQSLLTPLLAGPSQPGKTILAIVALLDGGAPASAKSYFSSRIDPGAPEIPELPEVDEVPEVPEQAAPRPEVPEVPEVAGRPKVAEIPGKRPAAAAIPKLPKLAKLEAVAAPQGPVQPGQSLPQVMAPGRAGRPKREAVPKVPIVKPYLPARLDVATLLAKRATEDELIAKSK